MRASIKFSMISCLAGAVAGLWLCSAGPAWAGGGGESLTSLQDVIGGPDGSTGFCSLLHMGTKFGNVCPQLPTFTQAILEAAGLEQSPPEMVAAQNGLPPGNNVYVTNPAALPRTPFPLTSMTNRTLLDLLSTLTPLAFISSPTSPTPVPLYDANANTFLYAVTVSSQNFHTAPGGTVPDTLYLFYDDLSQTTQNFKTGNIVAKFSFPLTVLSNGSESAVPTTLNFTANNAGDCSTSTVSGNFGLTQTAMASQIGIKCQVVFGASPTFSGRHAIFELAIPLVVTGACQNSVPPGFGICSSGQTAPGPNNTDPAYFYSLLNRDSSPAHDELAGQINLGLFTAFIEDDVGFIPAKGILDNTGSSSIGIAPTAGPLGSPPASGSGATFALCASLPGANGNGQAPIPSVAAYYAIAINGAALLSASLPSAMVPSTSVCPAL